MTNDTRPAPLVPCEVDLRDFPFTPMFRARLFGSEFHAQANDTEWRAGVTLWLRSWDQVPAGTLPTEDVALCRLAELGRDLKTWRKIRARALHGWRECSDGRLHHEVVAEGVLQAWERKMSASRKGKAGAAKRWGTGNGSAIAAANARAKGNDAGASTQAMLRDGNGQGQRQRQRQGEGLSRERDKFQATASDEPRARLLLLCEELGVNPATNAGVIQKFPNQLMDLLNSGLDFDRHILPAAREAKRRGTPVKSLKYLEPRAKELRAAEDVTNAAKATDAQRERMEWLKVFPIDGRWRPERGVGPAPHEPGTFVTDAELELVPGAKAMRDKLAKLDGLELPACLKRPAA